MAVTTLVTDSLPNNIMGNLNNGLYSTMTSESILDEM